MLRKTVEMQGESPLGCKSGMANGVKELTRFYIGDGDFPGAWCMW